MYYFSDSFRMFYFCVGLAGMGLIFLLDPHDKGIKALSGAECVLYKGGIYACLASVGIGLIDGLMMLLCMIF